MFGQDSQSQTRTMGRIIVVIELPTGAVFCIEQMMDGLQVVLLGNDLAVWCVLMMHHSKGVIKTVCTL